MKRRHVLRSVGGIAATSTLGAGVIGTAAAEDCDRITPGGPFPPDTAEENYSRFMTNAELYDRLEHLDQQSAVEYEIVGETGQGNPIPYAKLGDGDYNVFHVTQQHADEQPATEAVLDLLQQWGNGNGASHILDEVTIHAIPRINPDGWVPAESNETPTRENMRPDDECHDGPYFGLNQCGPVDPNRQHYFGVDPSVLAEFDGIDPDLIPDENPSPETQAMLDTVDEVDPDIVVDWHTQFTYHDADCELINVSMFWPINEATPQGAQDLSKQGVAAMRDAVQGRANGNVSRYPGGTTANIARNAYGVQGRGSILVEQRGQAPQLNNASGGQLIRHTKFMFEAIHEEAASGELFDRSPDEVDDLENFHGNFYWKDLPEDEQEEAEAWWEEYQKSH
jgi:hypothetical protein